MKNTIEEKTSLPVVDTEQSSPAAQITTTQPAADTQKSQTKRSLSAKHYESWVQDRGLDANWVFANISSVSAEEAKSLLGYPVQSAGVWIEGANLQGQFRPDKPWRLDLKCKAKPKYLTARGIDYDAILPNHPSDLKYWNNLETLKQQCYHIEGHPCLLITEGVAKAIAGCSNGIPTIALLGVEMGLTSAQADLQGKRYLVPALEKLAKAGFGFIIAFDADAATNQNVISAQLKLAKQLSLFGVPVYSATGVWSIDDSFKNQNKGMDDYIQNHTPDRFKRDVLAKAVNIESWEKQFKSTNDSENKKSKKPPSPRQLALELAEQYQALWTFHNEQKTWRIYNGKSWDEIEDEAFAQIVFNSVEAKGVEWQVPSYIENVLKVLKYKLLVKNWITFDRKRYIAFNNKVLDNETGELLDHSPGFRFTSYLPFDYNGLIDQSTDPLVQLSQNCPHIYDFLNRAMNGNAKKMKKLLAIINGAIKFRFFDLQMFVHLVGKPGTGKGTFARILNKLIGSANTKNSSLTSLGEGTEIASIIDKQLVIFPDERKKIGVEEILKLTGGDSVRYREIYKKRGEAFFLGLLLILSNNPVFAGDTTGIDRRLCLIQFLNPIPKSLRTSRAEENYNKEIPALIRVALAMKDEDVTNLIKGINGELIPEFKQEEWKMKCQVSTLAAWVNENVIHDPDTKTLVGNGRKNSERELNPETLFGNYLYYCEGANVNQTYHLNTFSSALVDLCTDTLEWEGIEKVHTKIGNCITGLRLRQNGSDDDIPTVEGFFANLVGEDPVKGGEDPVKTYGEDLKPLQNKEGEGGEDQNPIKVHENNHLSSPDACKPPHLLDKCDSDAFTPSPSSDGKGFESSSEPSPPLHQPSPSLHQPPVTPQPTYTDEQAWEEFNKKIPYPNPKSDNVQASKNRVRKIREAIIAANTKEDLSNLRRENGGEYSFEELKWTQNFIKFFYPTEYNHLMVTKNISQPNLLS
ncbi:MAG TPA: DUF3854 domain-containing protein [Stenomitos sp.]